MPGTEWTRAQVEELVAGLTVYVRTAEAEDLPVPEWIAEAAGDVGRMTSAERIDARHPDDQSRMADGWITALLAPGQPQELTYRTLIAGEWHDERCVVVNLIDQPDVAGMIVATETIGRSAQRPSQDDDGASDYAPARWLAFRADRYGTVVEMEGMCEELLGFSCADAIGQSALEFVTPSTKGHTVQMWLDMVSHPGTTHTGQLHMMGAAGDELWVDATIFHRVGQDDESDILIVARDVTEERARQDAMRQLAEEFRLLAEEVPAAVFRCDADGQLTFQNERWSELPGVDEGVSRIQDLFGDAARVTFEATVIELLAQIDLGGRALELAARDGRSTLAVSVRAVRVAGSSHSSLVGAVTDITADVALRTQAERDAVTGLLNRRAIEERVAQALDEPGAGVTVAFIDLDGFKSVNDVHGHAAGDAVLAEIGRRLASSVRVDDHVGRYGGDEFVVLARGTSGSPGATLADRLESVFEREVVFEGGSWQPAASIGQADADPDDTVASFIGRADRSMYTVKHGRRSDLRHGGDTPAASVPATRY